MKFEFRAFLGQPFWIIQFFQQIHAQRPWKPSPKYFSQSSDGYFSFYRNFHFRCMCIMSFICNLKAQNSTERVTNECCQVFTRIIECIFGKFVKKAQRKTRKILFFEKVHSSQKPRIYRRAHHGIIFLSGTA